MARDVTYSSLLRDHARGGFLWTETISQRLGAAIAIMAIRRGISPARVTIASLLVAVATSLVALGLSADVRWLAGVLAFVGWQLAYGFDCADGQVARATGTTSDAGARLDVTVDFATKLSILVAVAPSVMSAGLPVSLVVAASVGWTFPLFDEISGRDGDAATATVDRGSPMYQTIGLLRDGGLQKAITALALGLGPTTVAGTLLALGGISGLQLLARIAFLVQRSSTTSASAD